MQGVQIKRQYIIDEQRSFNIISLISAILVVLDHEEEKIEIFLSQTFFLSICRNTAQDNGSR
jgi:hypothetical protein